MTEQRPATVRFYFDADVLGVAKVVAALRYDLSRRSGRHDQQARPASLPSDHTGRQR